jgi:hypothetical protein
MFAMSKEKFLIAVADLNACRALRTDLHNAVLIRGGVGTAREKILLNVCIV